MTTQKNKTKAKTSEVITFEGLGNKLTQTLNDIVTEDATIQKNFQGI